MTVINSTGVTKQYQTTVALDRVDLVVEEGETFGFLGPNGAGKSTFINMLLDFVTPTEGSVSIFGHDCQREGVEARSRIGVLPEGYSVFERLTGRQHIEYAIRSKEAEADPIRILDRVGIRDDADRLASEYSKGMAQRLVLGMALVGEPDLLILDEPSTGLDPNGAARMREILREENDRGATIFFSSHILEQVEAVCDRVGILQDGELVAVDTIQGLRNSLGGGTKLVITVDEFTDGILAALRAMDGVETVITTDEDTIEVTCVDDVKMDILVELRDVGVDVLNFRTDEASLEDMFIEYTNASNR
ncbi:ABC transporter ATP-binding protein [Haloarcula salinisoli]|uniref:ABC transporter ATP-binding protein n=1 Tax=Haloarcula salinisoli TaxID=2487746 RepID=A0A8J7YPT7_9EURY|nr:ABC transporter ATP-binding protein [Halomicroarcula salinisoli]MBX0305691.1 ABC transporter ATP-binding protein [Halomicroarcula salinisoli]